jgi:hypothetical protein
MAYATFEDLKQVEPNIDEYGVLDYDIELARSEQEINRLLSVRWWPGYLKSNRQTFTATINLMDVAKLDPTQWTMAAVYHALAYHICPKLTQFGPEEDKFQIMMKYYAGRFEHEMDLAIRESVRYDADGDGTIQADERTPDTSLRLRR